MDSTLHPLKALLQLQLATDSSAVLHLPYVFSCVTSDCFSPNPHLTKWTTRINSLLYSKDAGGRWAGLCIALKTSELCRDTMVEFAQSWLGAALPMLSKNEPVPTIKASIHLLRKIFSVGPEIPEFQRQVATPNVPKFSVALIALVEKNPDEELKILILETLTHLVPIYPTLHRASHPALSALSLHLLNGSVSCPISQPLLKAASRLYSVLPFTGGKVGAANLWRKEVDETLAFGWNAFSALRTTFPVGGKNVPQQPVGEPEMTIPLNLDRLRCCIVIFGDLLSSTNNRPVQLPLGPLVQFATNLLSCSVDDSQTGHYDLATRAMEVSIVPTIWKLSCDLISCIARSVRHHLTPNLTTLISRLIFHLEQKRTSSQRIFLLTTLHTLLTHCHSLDSPLLPTRLAKAVLPLLSVILSSPAGPKGESPVTKGKKGRKRVRGYEGDEVFKVSRSVICPSFDDGEVLLAAFQVMKLLMRNINLSPTVHSISSRMLISVLLTLPQMSPALLSTDLSLHKRLLQVVHSMSVERGSGTTDEMSKSLGLIIRATADDESHGRILYDLDLLLHPRVPPLIRTLPHVENLSLFQAETPQEEAEALTALGLEPAYPHQQILSTGDITMEDGTNTSTSQPKNEIEAPPHSRDPLPPVPLVPNPQPTNSTPLPLSNTEQQKITSRLQPQTPPQPGPSNPSPPPPALPFPNSTQSLTKLRSPPAVPMTILADEEEDMEMPAINLDSDSDVDE